VGDFTRAISDSLASSDSIAVQSNLIHALLAVSCADFFVSEEADRSRFNIEFGEFSFKPLVKSLCEVSSRLVVKPELALIGFLQNAFALVTRLLYVEALRAEFRGLKAAVLLRSFAPSAKAAPIFQAGAPLAVESVSFLYVALLSHPGLAAAIARQKYSNSFVFHLIYDAELLFEKEGFSFVHSVILSALSLIVADRDAAVALNAPRSAPFPCQLALPLGSYADLLLGVLLNICKESARWPSLASIFHIIAPSLSIVSTFVASQIVELFDCAIDRCPHILPLFLEGFASIVQRSQTESNGFLVALFPRYRLFKQLAASKHRSGRALAIILIFLSAERKSAKATKQKLLPVNELAQVLSKVDADALFPQKQAFVRQAHALASELENAWPKWADFHFTRAFDAELAQLKGYKANK
jgi:hypothetical protein